MRMRHVARASATRHCNVEKRACVGGECERERASCRYCRHLFRSSIATHIHTHSTLYFVSSMLLRVKPAAQRILLSRRFLPNLLHYRAASTSTTHSILPSTAPPPPFPFTAFPFTADTMPPTSMPLESALSELFKSSTASPEPPQVRVVLAQTNPSGKSLSLVETLPPQGSDKDDFEPLLMRVFEKEPTRSGYALYRLDTQAANGEWEWLCIAYQPDGARVKEKMQYTLTRTSLLDGLSERHFLETLYATSSGDFKFPTKLRNARKHDYQNPQQRTAGKSAHEAAGTDAGGVKRNFGARAAGGNEASVASSGTVTSSSDKSVSTSAEESATPPAPESHEPAEAAADTNTATAPHAPEILSDISTASDAGAPLNAIAESAATGATTSGPSDEEDGNGGHVSIAPSAQGGSLPPADLADANEARQAGAEDSLSVVERIGADVHEQQQEEKKAPEEPPTRADVVSSSSGAAQETLSQPQVPSPFDASTKLHEELGEEVTMGKAPEESERQEAAREESKAAEGESAVQTRSVPDPAPTQLAASSSKFSPGTTENGSSGATPASGAGAPPSSSDGSPPKPASSLVFSSGAEAALSGLSQRLSAPSEHNFVSIVTTDGSAVDLASPPRFVPPGDLANAVQDELKHDDDGGAIFVFYRYPSEVTSKKTAFMYTESPKAAADKNIWLKSISPVQDRASQLIGGPIEREQITAQYGPYPRPTPEQAEEVASRIESIRRQIDEATQTAGRDKAPRLVAVSKLHPPSSIMAAHVHTGQLHFGENYVQEMVDKAKVLPREIRWHFVGGLQSNKGKALASVPNLYLLETLDSIKAANVLEKALAAPDAAQRDEPLRVYLQVNTSGEDAKSGVAPLSASDDASSSDASSTLVDLATHVITSCPHLILQGLMTIGSAANSTDSKSSQATSDRDAALKANPDFATIYESRAELVKRLREAGVQAPEASQQHYSGLSQKEDPTGALELSIGMTNDFPIAISAGSDNVRIGTACFGQRPGSREEARKGMENELSGGGGANDSPAPAAPVGDKGFAKPKRPGQSRK